MKQFGEYVTILEPAWQEEIDAAKDVLLNRTKEFIQENGLDLGGDEPEFVVKRNRRLDPLGPPFASVGIKFKAEVPS